MTPPSASRTPPQLRWGGKSSAELLLEFGEDLRPLAGAELVGDDLVVLDDEEPRRAAFARQLIEDRLEIAGPVALLVGLLELGRIDLDPRDLPVFRRSEPVGLVLVLPGGARLAVPAADIDHLEGRRGPRRKLQSAADQPGDDKGPTVHRLFYSQVGKARGSPARSRRRQPSGTARLINGRVYISTAGNDPKSCALGVNGAVQHSAHCKSAAGLGPDPAGFPKEVARAADRSVADRAYPDVGLFEDLERLPADLTRLQRIADGVAGGVDPDRCPGCASRGVSPVGFRLCDIDSGLDRVG